MYLLCIYSVLTDFFTGHRFGFIASGTVCWRDIDLFNVSSTWTLGLSCSIILVSSFQYINFSLGCCVFTSFFGLNSMVCSHIVGVHLSSDQVTLSLITLWWMLTCIIVFYCVCVSKVSSNLQCVLDDDVIFYFNLVCLLSLIFLVLYYIWYCHFY